MKFNFYLLLIFCLVTGGFNSGAQVVSISGMISAEGEPVPGAGVRLGAKTVLTDSLGYFIHKVTSNAREKLTVSAIGFLDLRLQVSTAYDTVLYLILEKQERDMGEIVVTGTLKEVKRMESPVPVEVYTPAFFKKNPTPNIFDALQNVNGVRPQLNCNVCNTGDIHINGLEGPYTMVLIDGMPIVSSLSTVYGLSGIPNSLVERIEIVKGPASSLYGSEAVGGLINIITKSPASAPKFSADIFTTSWLETNADLGFKFRAGKSADVLTGINFFTYNNASDKNMDGFTDVTLQDRISVFQKWSFNRKQGRAMNVAARYFYEDRWGGDTRWNKSFRGGDKIYGESIYTSRVELLGNYALPVKEKLMLLFSFNDHSQDSRYGITSYIARQQIAFTQLTWDKEIKKHNLLFGAAMRYTYYDDNSPATASADSGKAINQPQHTKLPGIFFQDEIAFSETHKLLLGARYDYNSIHGNIFTPRIAYRWRPDHRNIIRLNAGTGYRVVNLFTEDHAALTGARQVVVKNALKPERTYNVNLNYLKKIYRNSGTIFMIDLTGWFTYFNNRIIGDYDQDPNQIVYDNLKGHAISKGISLNLDINWPSGLKLMMGSTVQDVSTIENKKRTPQILTEHFTGNWALSYKIKKWYTSIDYTGNVYGPMRLPLLGPLDPRKPYSPTWSNQNIQFTYARHKTFEIYGGVKNLLNFLPTRGNPFIIARTHDPFDKQVDFDSNGKVLATTANPYALTFDPNYLFAPNQGIRCFAGFRFIIN